MKALFINPYIYNYESYHYNIAYPPGLYNVATYYKQHGHEVEVLDLCPEVLYSPYTKVVGNKMLWNGQSLLEYAGEIKKCGNWEKERLLRPLLRQGLPDGILIDKLRSVRYDEILIQCTFTYNYRSLRDTIVLCKREQPNAKVVIGGQYTRLCKDHAAKNGADKIIDRLPFDFIKSDPKLFSYRPFRIMISTAIGCPNNCKYCAIGLLEGHKRIERNIKDVLEDIEEKIDNGYLNFRFLDSNILINWSNHFKKILEGIIEIKNRKGVNLNLTTYGGVETDIITEEQAKLMREAGFVRLIIPLETSDPETLAEWGRPNGVEDFKRAVESVKKYFSPVGDTGAFILTGYPKQRKEVLLQSIELCRSLGCKPNLLAFTPIPGTQLTNDAVDLEDLHPILWPCAWEGFFASEIDYIFRQYVETYKSSLIKESDIIKKTIYKSGPAGKNDQYNK